MRIYRTAIDIAHGYDYQITVTSEDELEKNMDTVVTHLFDSPNVNLGMFVFIQSSMPLHKLNNISCRFQGEYGATLGEFLKCYGRLTDLWNYLDQYKKKYQSI